MTIYVEYEIFRLREDGTVKRTILYAGDVEQVTEGGTTRTFYYLGHGIIVVKQGSTATPYVAITDHLGSITRLVNASGTTVFSASYDAWGKQSVGTTTVKLHRGYTGHEMLAEYGLINMNGRLYDPQLGRFLSPDNYVQQPDNSQNFNRYSYCLNNPLKYNDPSGEWFGLDDLIKAGSFFVSGYLYNSITTGKWGISSVKAGLAEAFKGWFATNLGFSYPGLSQKVSNYYFSRLFPQVSMPLGNNLTFTSTPLFSFGSDGFAVGIANMLTYSKGKTVISFGYGATNNYIGANISATYASFGGGFGLTHYSEQTVHGNVLGSQTVGTISTYMGKDVSFQLSNDLFGDGEDRWRSSAAELMVKDFVVGTYVTTNWGQKESNNKSDGISYAPLVGGHKKSLGDEIGAWRNGKAYSGPFWVGHRSGNNIYRLGYSHPYVQSLTQNLVHSKMRTPFFVNYDRFYKGGFYSAGSYSPFSIW